MPKEVIRLQQVICAIEHKLGGEGSISSIIGQLRGTLQHGGSEKHVLNPIISVQDAPANRRRLES